MSLAMRPRTADLRDLARTADLRDLKIAACAALAGVAAVQAFSVVRGVGRRRGLRPLASPAVALAAAAGPDGGGVVDTRALPAQVHWGRPAEVALQEALDKVGSRRAFLLVSTSLRLRTDIVDELAASLGARCAGIWDGIPAHTPREAVIAAANAAREAGADAIVTLGGGSLTDGAKVVRAALAEHVFEAAALERLHYNLGDEMMGNPLRMAQLIPQITIPTTLSAGEFSFFAGCTNTAKKFEAGAKETYLYPSALPSAIILDPRMMVHTPPWLLLSTGLRSVDHCVEALCSLQGNPYSDTILQGALRLLVGGLRRAKVDPTDIAALLNCQIGIWQVVQGCQTGPRMGASHAIGHILGPAYDVPHGYTSCVLLPAVLAWNAGQPEAASRQRLVSEVFESLAADSGGEAARAAARGRSASEHVRSLVQELELPGTLKELGVGQDMLDDCARRSMEDPLVATNPRRVSGWLDVRQILDLAAG